VHGKMAMVSMAGRGDRERLSVAAMAALGPGSLLAAGWGWPRSLDPGVLSRACAATWARPGSPCLSTPCGDEGVSGDFARGVGRGGQWAVGDPHGVSLDFQMIWRQRVAGGPVCSAKPAF
jgi:hypothetical protein